MITLHEHIDELRPELRCCLTRRERAAVKAEQPLGDNRDIGCGACWGEDCTLTRSRAAYRWQLIHR
jgi:hypothetical protein